MKHRLATLTVFGAGFAVAWLVPSFVRRSPDKLRDESRRAPAVESLSSRRSEARPDYKSVTVRSHSSTVLQYLAVYRAVRDSARGNEREAERLLDLARQMNDSDVYPVLEGLAAANPEWLLIHLDSLSDGSKRRDAARLSLIEIARQQSPGAARKLYSLIPAKYRDQVISDIECTLAVDRGDVEGANRAAPDRGGMNTVLAALITNHPERLADLARAEPHFKLDPYLWAEYGPTPEDVLLSLASVMAPADFLRWAAERATANFSEALQIAAGKMEPAAVIAQCRTIAGTDLAKEVSLAGAMSRELARTAPAAGLKWLSEIEPAVEGRTRSEFVSVATGFAREWTMADPAAALAAASAEGSGSRMAEAIVKFAFGTMKDSRALEHWVVSNPAAAAELVTTLDPGPARDAGSRHMASALATTDPQGSLTWVAGISDAELRAGCFRQMVKSQQAAGIDVPAEVSRSALPASVRSEILGMLPP